ncbi:MAG: 16S rRNA (uracil(1498)-N(3))-methyltransferase [Clostridia bacterium]|nr:16S rRNA (uracil(1498)-N(3))-methyltransferase [Clostridia bacterium]
MSTFYIKNEQIAGNKIKIIGDDYNHLKNVLRYKTGEKLDVCDENAIRYNTKIIEYTGEEVICEIVAIDKNTTESPINITLYQGLPKADKLELIIQKATEIGVNEVYPVQMERSIVKLDEKNIDKKLDRWNKISAEASKQSGRQKIPQVHRVINLKNIIENISKYDIVLLPYENEKSATIKDTLKVCMERNPKIKDIAVIIGPEGGFSEDEIKKLNDIENVRTVTLGPRILRTETAGLATLSMLVYEFEL